MVVKRFSSAWRGFFSWWLPYVFLSLFLASIVLLAAGIATGTAAALSSVGVFGAVQAMAYHRNVRAPRLFGMPPPHLTKKERRGFLIGAAIGLAISVPLFVLIVISN